MESSGWFDVYIQFGSLCMKRLVPRRTEQQWTEQALADQDPAIRRENLLQLIRHVESSFPALSPAEYIRRIEDTQNWKDLLHRRSAFWDSLNAVLEEAVKEGAVRTVSQLAPHCLFQNAALKERLLQLAPNESTKCALTDAAKLEDAQQIRQYPLCISTNYALGKADLHTELRSQAFVRMPENLQTVVYSRFLQRHSPAVRRLLERITVTGEADLSHTVTARRLFALGYTVTEEGLHRTPIPECWLKADDPQGAALRQAQGISSLIAEMSVLGWKFKFHGCSNLFGKTGYYYLRRWS